MKPYLVVSDIHCHSWTLFSRTNPDGVNSRLRLILDDLVRAADTLLHRGGNLMVIAGDILHTRGQIDPEVLNPLRDTIDTILAKGVDVIAIPGNHDLKSAETMELASSIQNLQQVHPTGSGAFQVYNKPTVFRDPDHCIGLVPWRNTRRQLFEDLQVLATDPDAASMDVFIHAGIDGVLSGMPASGLTSAMLADYGFRRVFAGHYHNHLDFGNGVISIGATTHQNWGDIGTRAGFLMVDDKVTFHDSQAPKFVDISGLDEDEIELAATGNYVRLRGAAMTQEDVNDLRKALQGMGALGVSIEVPRSQNVTRAATSAKGLTLEQSIECFLDTNPPQMVDKAAVLTRSLEILHLSQAVAD